MIDFMYFKGCPNSEETLKNLYEALKELGLNEEVNIIEIKNIEMAQEFNFPGSPTILINGVDIYDEKKPEKANFACRVYYFNGEKSGIIPVSFIKDKLKRFLILS